MEFELTEPIYNGDGLVNYNADAPTGIPIKYVCPKCGTDRLVVYYLAHSYETRARCEDCDVDACVHSG